MDKVYMSEETIILPKEICEVPYSNEVDYNFSNFKFYLKQ